MSALPAPTAGVASLLLLCAIVCEVTATSALKASDGFTRAGPAAIVVVGYGLAFFFLAQVLRTLPVGVAYAVWSGLGTVGAALVGVRLFGERLGPPQLAGIALVVLGVALLNWPAPATPATGPPAPAARAGAG